MPLAAVGAQHATRCPLLNESRLRPFLDHIPRRRVTVREQHRLIMISSRELFFHTPCDMKSLVSGSSSPCQ
ncbi:hypothetical protein E2C01_083948 [Portunus trituberculatus]|uniref:Uncharacterized protein n=1 Tax=Portunus trituberculatus TaxID=210409 RepID=A0A5B7IWI7_PORTR|nr:hypothetical protein [Portunus trituberculatus]